jgi:energy-coupling factor transport system ATP-binding protein
MMESIVTIRGLQHVYLEHTPLACAALQGADLLIQRGEIAALIGESGAGKSTLVQFVNGLLRPSQPGQVIVFGQEMASPQCDLAALRRKVGLVFQYPHQQLFERFLGDDIAYGPRQLGLGRDELRERVRWAMEIVGLPFEAFVDRHTFSLSGGEMRRAALAGVLAMQPELLILDEATTGLDPRGRREVHALLRRLCAETGMTVLLVSNDMDEIAELAERVTVLYQGRTVLAGDTRAVMAQDGTLAQYGLASPVAVELMRALQQQGIAARQDALTLGEAEEAIWQAMTP